MLFGEWFLGRVCNAIFGGFLLDPCIDTGLE